MPQTQEAPKFLLLESIMDLIEEKIDPGDLRKELGESRISFEKIKADFESGLNELDEEVTQGTAGEIQTIYKVFGDWENAFRAIEEYFNTGQKFDLIRAGEMVKRCSDVLNMAFDDYQKKALLVMGPTDIPNLNLLIQTIKEVEEGAPTEKLKVITAAEFIVADGAIKELEYERQVLIFVEQELLIKAYKELQDAITKIGHFIKDGDKKLLKEGIEECKIVYYKIRELIPIVNYKRITFKPTSSPDANLLLNMAVALKKGEIQEEMFVHTLREVEESFNKMQIKFEALSRRETDSVLVKEEMERTKEGLNLFSNAISDYYRFLENREGLFLDQSEWELKDAVKILEKSHELFQEIADREGKTPCIRCGQYNQPDRKTCAKCGAILPKAADVTTASTFDVQVGETIISIDQEIPLPENLEVLFITVNEVAEGEITMEEFSDTVEDFYELMEANKSAGFAPLPRVKMETLKPGEKERAKGLMEQLKEAKALFEEGYRDFEEGVNYFREYIQVGDENMLVKGVQIIWEGNKKFHKVDQLADKLQEFKK